MREPTAMKVPRSPYAKTEGIFYFARMLDKLRLRAAGELREDLLGNIGVGFDRICVDFLQVEFSELEEIVLSGVSDLDALGWCFANGHRPSEGEVEVWNGFLRKFGWDDSFAAKLAERKAESGLAERDDIRTMFDYLDADEGRAVRVSDRA
ncbi:MAG: DUF5069 domain-containing protein [Chthoniobacterales bacterium]